ncbi:MAG: Fic family protein [Gemmatimonadetes bacterium]|nr:Fic family protein [Gemmatimonadota bacterium]
MKRGLQGRKAVERRGGEAFTAFVPKPLPPEPALRLDAELSDRLERANRALGRLDGLATMLPDRALFLYFYVRKEALLSSQIEGTQSSMSELLLFEGEQLPGVPLDDVREVSRYVAALDHGMARLRAGFPLSLRLIREIHEVLLSSGRGSERTPGEFRRSQNWLGGSRPGNAAYVPPPPEEVIPAMGALERFLHDEPARTPTLIKAALSHVQFETIHPFLDGNGRVGRLLVTLILCAEGALTEPMLYLSLYLKAHRDEYYDLLQRVRFEGVWEEWLRFFLDGVVATAEQATETARRILALFDADRARIEALGRAAGSALRVHEFLRRHPITTGPRIQEAVSLSAPAISTALRNLESIGIVREVSGRRWNRLFAYEAYLSMLSEGTEPLPRGG